MNKQEALKRLEGLPEETQKSVLCALVGHSGVVGICFGQVTCARCGEVVGDTLLGLYDTANKVIVGHDCPKCHENFNKLDWKSKYLTPNPFKKEKK